MAMVAAHRAAAASSGRASTRLLAAIALLLVFGGAARAGEAAPADLVLIRRGALPVIITAPHGGRLPIPGVEPRSAADPAVVEASRKWGGYSRSGDAGTDVLAEGIAAEIARLTGKPPYLVLARFQRRYADANRPPGIAFDSPGARPCYELYHAAIRRFVDEVRGAYPAGLLIDVHGQGKDPDVVMRGTLNGRGVARLVRRAGVEAVTGPRGIYGQLEASGFKVFPGNDVPPRGHAEDAGFNGGYTVFTYGSHTGNGIDTVQMEFGTRYRQPAVLERSARDAGRAIAAFYEAYLEPPARR